MGQATMFLSTRQAADRFGVSPRTLERYRGTGEGPVFYRFGRHVRYLQADLDAWAKTRRRISTRDEGNARRAAARWHARRSPRRAAGDRQGPGGPLRATRRTLGSRDAQLAGARIAGKASTRVISPEMQRCIVRRSTNVNSAVR